MDRQRANGGLGEYYSDGDTREPSWLIVGDIARAAGSVGLDGRAADGGSADPDLVARWLDDGIAPNGAHGRAFRQGQCAWLRPDLRRAQERVAAAGADGRCSARRSWRTRTPRGERGDGLPA